MLVFGRCKLLLHNSRLCALLKDKVFTKHFRYLKYGGILTNKKSCITSAYGYGKFPAPSKWRKKYGKPETLHLDGTWNSEGSRSMAFHGSIRFLCGWKAMLVTLLIVSLEIWKLDTPTKTKTQKVTVYLFFTNFRKLFGPLWQVNIAIAGISPFFNRKYIFKWSIFQQSLC